MSRERRSRVAYGFVFLAVSCAMVVALAIARRKYVAELAMLALSVLIVAVALVRATARRRRSSPTCAERRLSVQHAVTTVLAEAPSIAVAMPRILEAVCSHLDWGWGALWTVDEAGAVLRFAACWHHPDVVLPAFERESRARTFARGVGLPGRVWQQGVPAWIADVTADDNFPRAPIAAAEGLRGAFAFPVLLAGNVLGVLEFFARAARAPDEWLLETLATLGSQIGQFLERTRAEERLRASERALAASLQREQAARGEAEAASRAKDEFLAIVSHELRAPLTPMLLWTRMLQGNMLDEAARMRAIEVIESNARAQAQLVEDLLDVSRIVTGKLRLEVAPVALARVIEEALESTRPASEARGVEVVLALDPDVGMVHGDAGRLQQVVWNLLSNAVKFTPRGGRVDVRLAADGDELELTVRDTGSGISQAFLPHVFERFRQADGQPTRAHGGLGLGLAIVRHLVEAHGGRVRAESAGDGQGATFVVCLPRYGVAASADDTGAAARSLPRERLRGRRVLMVDDDADTRSALGAILTNAGAELRDAESAAAAMEVLRAWRPDLLVSDLGLPDEDGYTLMRRIRALAPSAGGNVPAVALTGYARAADRARCIEAGFQRHVVKPVDPVELIDVVATVLAEGAQPRVVTNAETAAPPSAATRPATEQPAAAGGKLMTPDADAVRDALAFVSHELRQPLAALRIWLNLLEAEIGESLTAAGQDHLAQIHTSVAWMAELIAGRLTAEIESGPPRT